MELEAVAEGYHAAKPLAIGGEQPESTDGGVNRPTRPLPPSRPPAPKRPPVSSKPHVQPPSSAPAAPATPSSPTQVCTLSLIYKEIYSESFELATICRAIRAQRDRHRTPFMNLRMR